MTYTEQLAKWYSDESSYMDDNDHVLTKLEFVAESIFDFTLYDSEMDELFAKKMLEVIKVMLDKSNFEYQENRENYINYLTMVNMPFLVDKIEWGTSIRGAWIDSIDFDNVVFDLGHMEVPKTDIEKFLTELTAWVGEQ